MPKFEIGLWERELRRIPQTSVEAETSMQACALGLDDFRRLKVPFTADTSVDVREENQDDTKSESARVSSIIEWANSKAGKAWVTTNGLDWLLTFK
jgi:hypothetical protein